MAVKATVETVESNGKMEGNIGEILKKVKPAVEQAKKAGVKGDELFTSFIFATPTRYRKIIWYSG